MGLQGGFEFSKGSSAKWIFDVEIEKLRAGIYFTWREDQNHAWCRLETTNRAFETNILKLHFHISQLNSRLNNLEWKFDRTSNEQFFNVVLLLTRTWYHFNHLGIPYHQIYHYSRLAFCLFCALPPLRKFFTWIIFLVAAPLFMLYLSQNNALCRWETTNRVFEGTNYTHKNTGVGHNF